MTALFWYFLSYSFLGFVVEVLFARIVRNPKRDRKCLYFLPLCPVYGLGAVLILLLPAPLLASPLLLLPCAALLCTGAEYFMGLFYEKVASVPFWDYSHFPLNIGGKVCPLFTLFWGLLALGLVYGVHPSLSALVTAIPNGWLAVAVPLFLADVWLSLHVLRQTGSTDALRWYRRLRRQSAVHR